MIVGEVKIKSSAASISIRLGEGGRDPIPICPSGLPVLKKKTVAAAGKAYSTATANANTSETGIKKRTALPSRIVDCRIAGLRKSTSLFEKDVGKKLA
jgi:hypothetical protein